MTSTISKEKKWGRSGEKTFWVESLIQRHHRNKCVKMKIEGK